MAIITQTNEQMARVKETSLSEEQTIEALKFILARKKDVYEHKRKLLLKASKAKTPLLSTHELPKWFASYDKVLSMKTYDDLFLDL